jgi:hypothetical protein
VQHAGSHAEAAAQMEVARKLDLADRFVLFFPIFCFCFCFVLF